MRTAWDVGIAVKNAASPTLRNAVAKIIDEMKIDGSLRRVFAVHEVDYVEASAALARNRRAAMRIKSDPHEGEIS